MKAAENVLLYRTDGNTDDLRVKLTALTDSGEVAVDDAATVTMEVKTTPTVTTIPGVSEGGGIFSFATTGLPPGAGKLKYDIDVTESGVKATYARGTIVTAAKIGT